MEKNQKHVCEELGVSFEEALELFSEETLDSIKMSHLVGGRKLDDKGINFKSCTVNKKGCMLSAVCLTNCGCI